MAIAYAVSWQEDGAASKSGRLDLGVAALRLEGANGAGPATHEIPYRDLDGFHLARASRDRLAGRPTLVIEHRTGGTVKIAAVGQAGILGELADRLSVVLGTKGAN